MRCNVSLIRVLYRSLLVTTLLVCGQNAPAQAGDVGSRFFYGGSVGLAFGDVDYYELAPMVGIQVNRRFSTGLRLLYRHRQDNRYDPSLSTDDYGATIFGRFHLTPRFYLQAEYEYVDYEYVVSGTTTARADFSSWLAGGGVSTPIGPNSHVYATALYNFSYDEPDSPYSDPWTLSVGVGFGF
jgi:hypothetical protein